MDSSTKANVHPTQTLSLIDDRLSIDKTVYSDSDATPEKPKRRLKRPLPDDDDFRSLGSHTKPISKKSKDVERLRQHNASEFQQLRNEIHLLRTEQRRMSHDTISQTNASVRTYSSYVPKRQVPAEIFTAFRNVNRILVKDLYMQRT